MSAVAVANAPLSYGAFEATVGTAVPVPAPERVLAAIADAGYAGTELGPPGYLGEAAVLGDRLAEHGLALTGGFVPMRFSEPEHWDADRAGLQRTLDLLAAAGARDARPVLCDAGGLERLANPGRGGADAALRLDDRRWRRLLDGVARAAEAIRAHGFEPVFHHHVGSYVEAPVEIERLLADSDVPLLLDSGHLAFAGGDPLTALRDWGERIELIHLKDVRMDVRAQVHAERADMLTAWRRGVFCRLGDGDLDLDGLCGALAGRGYAGWVVIEQDRVLDDHGGFAGAAVEQVANRAWLRAHAGW